jgi:hypothetical protein
MLRYEDGGYISLRRAPGFDPTPVPVTSMVDKVAP